MTLKEAVRARGAPRSLLNKLVSSSINENKINKRLDDYAYKANIKAKRTKSDVREPKESIHGKPSSLLNKIVGGWYTHVLYIFYRFYRVKQA